MFFNLVFNASLTVELISMSVEFPGWASRLVKILPVVGIGNGLVVLAITICFAGGPS